MRFEQLELGPVPYDESCAQSGEENFHKRAQKEVQAFVRQLQRQFPELPDGCQFRMISCPHDFGTYYEAVIRFNDNDDIASEFAFRVENEVPANWDEIALQELAIKKEENA